jgi:hypothetical protein
MVWNTRDYQESEEMRSCYAEMAEAWRDYTMQTTVCDVKAFVVSANCVAFVALERCFTATAMPDSSVIEYQACTLNQFSPEVVENAIIVPGVTITTFRALCESSLASTLTAGLASENFAERLQIRLQSLVAAPVA